ncbi:MAG: dephospho-CoA kinase [Candidatus Shapirobacteria bacterium]|nr:dephospho-CoA kinase [Candidatus Shapirobacteria bacterium]
MVRKIKIFGLTGDMGCGKSTVTKLLKNNSDVCVIDCDKVAKEILNDNKNLKKIRLILGDEILVKNRIDRQKISQIIFCNNEKKQKLESFIHPKVWKKILELIRKEDNKKIFVVESAIIYEIGWEKKLNKIILVVCNKEEQRRRIKLRDKLTDEQINERLKGQLTNKYKRERSWVVIDTNCSLEKLKQKTDQLYSYLRTDNDDKLVL